MTQKLSQVLSDLEDIDQDTRFDLLIEYADEFKEVPPSVATRPFKADNKVPACESEAYVFSEYSKEGTVKYYFAVENPQGISAKAMAVILDQTLSGSTPSEIQNIPEDIVYKIFGRTISMGKGQGLMGMVQLVKYLATKR